MLNGTQRRPLTVGVPGLQTYHPESGIGRVLCSIGDVLREEVEFVDAPYATSRLPVLRNIPAAVLPPPGTDLILHPRILGAQALRRTGGLPSVAIVHDVGIVDYPGDGVEMDWITRRTTLLGISGLRHATHIVSVSDFTTDRLVRHCPELDGRITTIPDGVSTLFLNFCGTHDHARSDIERRIGKPLGTPLLIYVGSELPRKNISTLLGAFRLVLDVWPSATLLKVGRAGHARWRKQTLEVASELGIRVGSELVILEDLPDSLLVRAYKAADVMLSASEYEGFGLPALEAMAVGVPVVATNRGAFPEVCGDVCRVVNPSRAAIAGAVVETLNDPFRSDQIQRGRDRASSYHWEQSAKHYLNLFNSLVPRPAANGHQLIF